MMSVEDQNSNGVSIASTSTVITAQGCRMEPNLCTRPWISGPVGTVTSPTTFTYAFPNNAQYWQALSSPPSGVQQAWTSSDGHAANGCLEIRGTGAGSGLQTGSWKTTLCWQSLGAPAGSTITSINFSIYDIIATAGVTSTYTLGPYSLYDSTNTTLISTLVSGRVVGPGTTTWSQQNSGTVSISAPYQDSTTVVTLRIEASVNSGDLFGNAARFDDVVVNITYT